MKLSLLGMASYLTALQADLALRWTLRCFSQSHS
jgi:hypothetical protein